MSRCACLHADETTSEIREEADPLGAPQLPPHNNGSVGADRVYLENVLRQIQSDGGNLLLHVMTPRRGPTTAASSHSYAGAGGVYAITQWATKLISRSTGTAKQARSRRSPKRAEFDATSSIQALLPVGLTSYRGQATVDFIQRSVLDVRGREKRCAYCTLSRISSPLAQASGWERTSTNRWETSATSFTSSLAPKLLAINGCRTIFGK